jgi:hypothetical protein
MILDLGRSGDLNRDITVVGYYWEVKSNGFPGFCRVDYFSVPNALLGESCLEICCILFVVLKPIQDYHGNLTGI